MLRFGQVVWAVLAALFALTGQAAAARFCFVEWPPYTVMRDGQPAGLSVEIYQQASQRMGIQAEFDSLPWGRCLESVLAGHHDAAMDAGRRQRYVQGPHNTILATMHVWVRQDAPEQAFTGLPVWRGRRVGLVVNYAVPEALTTDPEIIIERAPHDQANLDKLVAGRIDAVLTDLINTRELVQQRNLPLRALWPPVEAFPLYPSFTPSQADLQQRFDATIAAMQADGTLDALYLKHLGLPFSEISAGVE